MSALANPNTINLHLSFLTSDLLAGFVSDGQRRALLGAARRFDRRLALHRAMPAMPTYPTAPALAAAYIVSQQQPDRLGEPVGHKHLMSDALWPRRSPRLSRWNRLHSVDFAQTCARPRRGRRFVAGLVVPQPFGFARC